jgi:integrase
LAGRCADGRRYTYTPHFRVEKRSTRSGRIPHSKPLSAVGVSESTAQLVAPLKVNPRVKDAVLVTFGTIAVTNITAGLVAQCCERFKGRGYSPGYRRTLHSYLRNLLRTLGAHPEVFGGFPPLKPVRPRENTVSAFEFDTVFSVAGPLLQLAMLLAREAGIRHATIMAFSATNCNFEARFIIGRSKAYSSYCVPMSHRLEARLRLACAGANDAREPLLCQYNRQRKPPHYNSLTCALSRAKKLAGVTTVWGLHDLRRTGARALYERTHDIRKVQRFLGHASPGQSWWYLGNAGIDLSNDDMEPIAMEPIAERLSA